MTEAVPVEFGEVTRVDPAAIEAAGKLRGTDAFGNLSPVLDWIAGAQGSERIKPIRQPRLVAFSGHHTLVCIETPVVHPPPVDTALVNSADTDLMGQLCSLANVGFQSIDASPPLSQSQSEQPPSLTKDADRSAFGLPHRHPPVWHRDALTAEECSAAMQLGKDTADAEVDSGADFLIPALLGTGHEVPIGVLICALTRLEPTEVVIFADETDAAVWSTTVAAVRDALFRARSHTGDVRTLLRTVGGADIAALTGFLAQAAIRRTPVLLDGIGAHVAAVLAHRLAEGAESWFYSASVSTRRSGRRLAELLGLQSVVDLGIDSDSATAALLVLPMLRTAAQVLSPS